MRYTEPKARSAELLRQALAHMGRHEASFNPISFTVWYEYAAGVNGSLSEAVGALLAQAATIDDAAILALYQAHVASPDRDAVDRIGSELQRLMTSVSQSATQAGHKAGHFGEQLSGFKAALASHGPTAIDPHLGDMLAGTAEMKSSVEALQQRVAKSQGEIDRLRNDLERARGEALLDPLTGILNRKGFDQRLQRLMSEVPPAGTSHCLVMLDIDHFKKVNDTHGHVVGDRVIQGLGEVLRSAVTDPSYAAARYGGEEFAIIVPHSTIDRCAQVAETVRARTKAMRFRNRATQDVVLTVTVSGGVAAMREGDDAAALISRADAALYASKHAGRDRVTCA
jgi:diguanylate cyclase